MAMAANDKIADVAPSFGGSVISRCENAQDWERLEDVDTVFAVAGD
jgi:hypothetical protein